MNEPKLCGCGCGQPTAMIPETNHKRGYLRGEFYNYIKNHSHCKGNSKSPETTARMSAAWKGRPRPWLAGPKPGAWKEDTTPSGLHSYLKRHFRKTGICQRCGKIGKTDVAFLRHPSSYTRTLSDYQEMCRSCHVKFDYDNGARTRTRRIVCRNGHDVSREESVTVDKLGHRRCRLCAEAKKGSARERSRLWRERRHAKEYFGAQEFSGPPHPDNQPPQED